MNIAIIEQGYGKYLFEVPEGISLKEGEKVKCDTKRGVTDGTVWADSITTDEPTSKLIGKLLGAKFPLKSAVGKTVTSVEMFEQPKQPKREPVKLYCVESSCSGERITVGKTYEVNAHGRITYDDGTLSSCEYGSDAWKNKITGISSRLFPLVSRPAKVGEFIRNNSTGEVCEVIALSFSKHAYVRTKVGNKTYNGGCADRKIEHPFDLWEKTEYLVLDGYKPEPEKAEPEYLNMRVVCVAGSSGFTVGKVYEFKNGVAVDDDGDVRPSNGDQRITSLSDAFMQHWPYKFIEFKGE